MLREQIRQHILNLTHLDLVEYVRTGTELYDPEAVEFARQELGRRNLSPDQLAEFAAMADEREQEQAEAEIEAAERRLGWGGAVLAFLAGMIWMSLLSFFALFIASTGLRRNGEYQKLRDMWMYVFAGAVFSVILTIVIVIGPRF